MRAAILASACLILATAAFGAEQPVVVNTGTATSYGTPATVEFTLLKDFKETDLKTAAEKCAAFVAQAAGIATRGRRAAAGRAARARDGGGGGTRNSVRGGVAARFFHGRVQHGEHGAGRFCGAGATRFRPCRPRSGATLKPPKFSPGENDTAVTQAVTKATENAYAAAESLAFALKRRHLLGPGGGDP